VTLPVLTYYFYAPYPGGLDWAASNTATWDPPTGVTAATPGAGIVFYAVLFGPMTSVTPVDDWTPITTGSVGGSNFFLFRRETGGSEPANYRFNYPALAPEDDVVIVGIGVAGVAEDIAATPQFDIGDTALSDALTVPAGNVLSVHIWGGAKVSGLNYEAWTPDTTEFPSNRRFGYAVLYLPYTATIGEIRDVTTAPGKAATVSVPGSDNFGIQFLFSDVPVSLGGWGVGQIRMGA